MSTLHCNQYRGADDILNGVKEVPNNKYSRVSELLSPLVLFKIDHNRGLAVILSTRTTRLTGFVLYEYDLNSELTLLLV